MPTDVDPHVSQQARNAAEELVKAYIAAYETKDATAYLSLFSKGAVYVDFAVQVHAKIRQLKEELVSSFRRQDGINEDSNASPPSNVIFFKNSLRSINPACLLYSDPYFRDISLS